MQTRRNSPKENATKESLNLREGETYTLTFVTTYKANGRYAKKKRRMKLLKCYKHHAVFEDAKGMQHSFRYWDIEKLFIGEPR